MTNYRGHQVVRRSQTKLLDWMMLQQTIDLKLEEAIKVWIMFSFMVEPMPLAEIEKGTFNNLFLSSLEFFQCKIWVNLFLNKKFLIAKIKEGDQEVSTVKDQKWLISFIKETTISMDLIRLEIKLNSISRCNICSSNKVSSNNSALTISQSTNWFKVVIEQSLNLRLPLIPIFWVKVVQLPIRAFIFRILGEVLIKAVLCMELLQLESSSFRDLLQGIKILLKIWVSISIQQMLHLQLEVEWEVVAWLLTNRSLVIQLEEEWLA